VTTLLRADDLAHLPRTDWDLAVHGTSFYNSYSWLLSTAETFERDRMFVIAKEARPVAAAMYRTSPATYKFYNPLALLRDPQLSAATSQDDLQVSLRRTEAAVSALHPLDKGTAAIIATPYGFTQPISSEADQQSRQRILDELTRQASAWEAPVAAVMYVDDRDVSLAAALTDRDFVRFAPGGTCLLTVPPGGRAEYLRGLSAGRRYSILREMRGFESGGLHCEIGDLTTHEEELAVLQSRLQASHGHQVDHSKELRAIRALRTTFGDEHILVLAKRGEEIAGFILSFMHEQRLYAKLAGFDETVADKRQYAYFNTVYYYLLGEAHRRGLSVIDYGPYSYRVKIGRGCVLQPFSSWVRVPRHMRSAVEDVAALQRLPAGALPPEVA